MPGTNYTDTKAQTSLYISSSQMFKIQNWDVEAGPVAMEWARLPGSVHSWVVKKSQDPRATNEAICWTNFNFLKLLHLTINYFSVDNYHVNWIFIVALYPSCNNIIY